MNARSGVVAQAPTGRISRALATTRLGPGLVVTAVEDSKRARVATTSLAGPSNGPNPGSLNVAHVRPPPPSPTRVGHRTRPLPGSEQIGRVRRQQILPLPVLGLVMTLIRIPMMVGGRGGPTALPDPC